VQQFLPAREIDAVRVGDESLAVREADHRNLEAFRPEVVALLLDLPQDGAADIPDADHGERQPLARLEEALVNRVQRAPLLRRVDDARDVALGSALRDRADVDVLPAE